MKLFFITAALIAFGSTALHVFAGGAEIHVPIQESGLNTPLKAISAVLWHAVTLTLLAGGIVACALVVRPHRLVALGIALFSLGYIPIFMFYAQTMLGSVWAMPQWVLFLAFALFMSLGARKVV